MKEKASGRAHIVRWTMVLRRPEQSVDCAARREEACSRAEQKIVQLHFGNLVGKVMEMMK